MGVAITTSLEIQQERLQDPLVEANTHTHTETQPGNFKINLCYHMQPYAHKYYAVIKKQFWQEKSLMIDKIFNEKKDPKFILKKKSKYTSTQWISVHL